MNVKEIKDIAQKMDINPGKMKKTDLIRTIQMKEGHMPCYQTDAESCDQMECCWRSDCLQ